MQLQEEQDVPCPCCLVPGFVSHDGELARRMDEFKVKCPYVSRGGDECQWRGRYYDFWDHLHVFRATTPGKRKRSEDNATQTDDDDDDDDAAPAAKRQTITEHHRSSSSSHSSSSSSRSSQQRSR